MAVRLSSLRQFFESGPALAGIHAELVALLYSTIVPIILMGVSTVAFCIIIALQTHDPVFGAMAVLLTVIIALRITSIVAFRTRRRRFSTQDWERIYAAGSFSFSLLLGLMGLYAFLSDSVIAHMLAIALLFAYSAGLIARVSVRPWIASTSVVLLAVPYIAGIATNWSVVYLALAILVIMMLAAGLETVAHMFRVTREHLSTRARFAELARADPLTGLPNRLMLDERLDAALADLARTGDQLAVHFIDLDRFKEANDRYGHPTGDALLREVAERLTGLLRRDDFVARLGGDEFVIVQAQVLHASEAELLGRRIVRTLAEPFEINGNPIVIGASVGIAMADKGAVPAKLIAESDQALYGAKRSGRGNVVLSPHILTMTA